MSDYRDRFPRVSYTPMMGGIRIPSQRPCVVVNETAIGNVSFTHYDRHGFILHKQRRTQFTSEAWGRAVAFARERSLPIFRTGTHETAEERLAR